MGSCEGKIASAVEGKKEKIESDPALDDSSARGDAADDSKVVKAAEGPQSAELLMRSNIERLRWWRSHTSGARGKIYCTCAASF
jgi:hypothetical protein